MKVIFEDFIEIISQINSLHAYTAHTIYYWQDTQACMVYVRQVSCFSSTTRTDFLIVPLFKFMYVPLPQHSRNLAVSYIAVFPQLCFVILHLLTLIFSHFQDEKQNISLLWPNTLSHCRLLEQCLLRKYLFGECSLRIRQLSSRMSSVDALGVRA